MRILQVAHNFLPYGSYGGAEVMTYNLCKELSKSHEILIFCRGGNYFRKRPALTCELYDGLAVQRIYCQADSNFQGSFRSEDAERMFERVLAEVKPEVVHFQHLLGLSCELVSIAKLCGVPTVLHLRDFWYLCPNVKLLYANIDPCEGPGNLFRCVQCQQAGGFDVRRSNFSLSDLVKVSLPSWFVQRIAENRSFATFRRLKGTGRLGRARNSGNIQKTDIEDLKLREQRMRQNLLQADVIISNSDFVRQKYLKWGLSPSKVKTIYNGHDLSSLQPLPKTRRSGVHFGYLGGLTAAKGVDILIKAFSQLNDNRSSLSIHGEGEREFVRSLRSLAYRNNVRFAGRYRREQLTQILSNIDVLVVPSIWPEAYGIVIQEAFMAKVAVIASRVGAIPESVVHGVNGLLFEPGNVEELLRHMERILKEVSLLEDLRRGIGTPKSIQENAREVEQIYYSLVVQPGRYPVKSK